MEKCCKESDRSSPSSVYKIKQGSSESNYSLPSNASDNTLIQIISNSGIPYEKPVAYRYAISLIFLKTYWAGRQLIKLTQLIVSIPCTYRQSITYDDEEAYYTSKEAPGSYGSITAIKNR